MKFLKINITFFCFYLAWLESKIFTYNKDISKIIINFDLNEEIEPIKKMNMIIYKIFEVFTNYTEYKNVFPPIEDENAIKNIRFFRWFLEEAFFLGSHDLKENFYKLNEISKKIINLNSYIELFNELSYRLNNVYKSNEITIITSYINELIIILDKFNYFIKQLDLHMKRIEVFCTKKFCSAVISSNDESSTLIIGVKIVFHKIIYYLNLFNVKMKEKRNYFLNLCFEWNSLSIKEKFIICYGEEHPFYKDSIENALINEIECLSDKVDFLLIQQEKFLFLYDQKIKNKALRDFKLFRYSNLLYYVLSLDFYLEKLSLITNVPSFYLDSIHYIQEKSYFLQYICIKYEYIKCRRGVLIANKYEHVKKALYYSILYSFNAKFQLFERFLKNKLFECRRLNTEEKNKFINLLIEKLNISKDEAVKYIDDFKSGNFRHERFSSSQLHYFSKLSSYITLESTSELKGLHLLINDLQKSLISLRAGNSTIGCEFLDAKYDDYLNILKGLLIQNNIESMEFYYHYKEC
ncbi:hypothetical protein H311_00121 [Anncaliia algerae PRA109]|nr:hypothetical protein H311_00121 [Anncaliia algerae PRA109]